MKTHHSQTAEANTLPSEQVADPVAVTAAVSEEERYRAGAYGLLASLLRNAPDRSALERVAGFAAVDPARDDLTISMSMLGLAADNCEPHAVETEFHDLFIGLGRGELIPYGSWYITGFLMEKPLGRLRSDLAELGYQKNQEVCEPEDHVAALCEVMSMLIAEGADPALQARFFESHMSAWIRQFFVDLSQAKSATFYRAVGRFGIAFMELEQRYQAMQV